jgi:hypothetical protein
MQIIITAGGLYFTGKVRDFRRFLAARKYSPLPLIAYLQDKRP